MVSFIVSIIVFGRMPEHSVSVFIHFWPVWRFGNTACRFTATTVQVIQSPVSFLAGGRSLETPSPHTFPMLGWLGPASLCNFPNQAIRTKIFSLSDVRFSHRYTIISVTFLVYSETVTVTAFQGRQSENGHLHILILILIWWHASGVATSSSPTRCLDWFFFAKSFAKRTEVMKREDVGISWLSGSVS